MEKGYYIFSLAQRYRKWLVPAVISIIILLPLFWMIAGYVRLVFSGPQAEWHLLTGENTLLLLMKSLRLSLWVSGISLLISFPLAWLFEYRIFRAAGLFRLLVLLPIFFPPYILAISWADLFGELGLVGRFFRILVPGRTPSIYDLWGSIMVLSLWLYPLAFLFITSSLRRYHRLSEAATLNHGPYHTFLKILLPLSSKGIAGALVFTFLMAFGNFAVPAVLRQNVFPVEIFTQYGAFFNHANALVFTLPFFIVSLLLLVLLLTNIGYSAESNYRNGRIMAPGKQWIIILLLGIFLIITTGLPLLNLLSGINGIQPFIDLLAISGNQILATLLYCGSTALILTIAAYYLSVFARLTASYRLTGFIVLSTFCIPGIVYGIALINIWNSPHFFGLIYNTPAMLVLSFLKYLPVAWIAVSAAMATIPKKFDEAASMAGHGQFLIHWRIILPQISNGVLGAFILLFIFCFSELDSIILVCPPGVETVSMSIFSLLHYGANDLVNALCIIQILVIILAILTGWKWISKIIIL